VGLWFIHDPMGGALTKSSREIMECAWSAAKLAGVDAKID
jgi:hypothetical protein